MQLSGPMATLHGTTMSLSKDIMNDNLEGPEKNLQIFHRDIYMY